MKGFFALDSDAKKGGTVRNQIVAVLAKRHPLLLSEIHKVLMKDFGSRVSLQATSKAARMLLSEGILARNEAKGFMISRNWIFDSKKFFDSLAESYSTRSKSRVFNELFKGGDYGEYHLKSLFELDNFWCDLLIHIAENARKPEEKEFAMWNNLGWWFLINYASEITLYRYYREKGMKGIFLYPEENFVNVLAVKNYASLGFRARIVGKEVFPRGMDVNSVGIDVIQVHYPQKIVEKLWKFVARHDSVKEVNIGELNKILGTKCDIKMIHFKNSEMAKSIRGQLRRGFAGK